MSAIIRNEIRHLLNPLYIIITAAILLFTWRICLPPFDNKAIYDTSQLIRNYEFIMSSIGLFSFFVLLLKHFRKINNNSNRYLLSLRISGREYFFGLYILYYAFFFIAFIIPANLSALIQQLIFAPQQIEPEYYFYSMVGHFFSFYHIVIFVAIIIVHQINDDFLAQILFLLFQILLIIFSAITGMNIFSTRIHLLQFYANPDQFPVTGILLFWVICSVTIIIIGFNYSKSLLYKFNRTNFKTNIISKWMNRCYLYVTAHHTEMMNMGPQKTISVCIFIGLFMLLGVNHSMQNQLLDSVYLYVYLVIPIIFTFNQSFILKIDQYTGMRESIVLKSRNYSSIILNRWLVLVTIQIIVQFIAILVIYLFTGFWEIYHTLCVILFGIIISLFNLLVNAITWSNGTANLILIFLIYIQLNEKTRVQAEKYVNFDLLIDNLLNAHPVNSKWGLFLSIQIILLLILLRIVINLTKYVRIRFHN